MTVLLSQAFDKASRLPPEIQDEVASVLMEEIESEMKWTESFARSEAALDRLAEEALKEFREGKTSELDFDDL